MMLNITDMFVACDVAGRPQTPQTLSARYNAQTPAPTTENIMTLNKPSSLTELLENIRYFLYSKIPLSDDFYDNDVIKKCFGGDTISRREANKDRLELINISGFDDLVDPVTVKENKFSGISLNIRRLTDENKKIYVTLNLSFMAKQEELSFENVENIFGDGWELFPYFPIPPTKIVKPATNAHGNQRIKYSFDQGSYLFLAIIEFNENGTLIRSTFKLEAK